MWDKRSQYVGNHDGDNATMILDQGFGDTKQIEVRLLGVYAPELKDVGGPETAIFVRDWFLDRVMAVPRWGFIVTTARMKVADREQMSLTRYLGTITTVDGSDNLNVDVMEFIRQRGYGGGTGMQK